jgi:hypothetical protein
MQPEYIEKYEKVRNILLIDFHKVKTEAYYNTKRERFRVKGANPETGEVIGLPHKGLTFVAYNTFSGVQYCHSQARAWLLIHFKGHVIISNTLDVFFDSKPHRTQEFYIHVALASFPTLLREVPTWKYRNLVRFRDYAIHNEAPPTDAQLKSFDLPLTDEELESYEASFRLCGH